MDSLRDSLSQEQITAKENEILAIREAFLSNEQFTTCASPKGCCVSCINATQERILSLNAERNVLQGEVQRLEAMLERTLARRERVIYLFVRRVLPELIHKNKTEYNLP